MVLIDTSVWISLYRKKNHELGQHVWALVAKNQAVICGQVWVEFIGGFRKDTVRKDFAEQLKSFPFLETSKEAFFKAGELLAQFPHLGSGDVIIAATAMNHGIKILTIDRDFRTLIKKGLKLYMPM